MIHIDQARAHPVLVIAMRYVDTADGRTTTGHLHVHLAHIGRTWALWKTVHERDDREGTRHIATWHAHQLAQAPHWIADATHRALTHTRTHHAHSIHTATTGHDIPDLHSPGRPTPGDTR